MMKDDARISSLNLPAASWFKDLIVNNPFLFVPVNDCNFWHFSARSNFNLSYYLQ
jgi:hypothetical protein